MQYQEFIESVRERAGLENSEETVSIVHATLETLAERLKETDSAKLAAQLPTEIGAFITNRKAESDEFDMQEFVRRVGERAQIDDLNTASQHAAAVLAILQDAVPRNEFDAIRATFPDEYNPLFELESSEAMSTRY